MRFHGYSPRSPAPTASIPKSIRFAGALLRRCPGQPPALIQLLARNHNGPIEGIWQSSVAAAYHHEADDDFAKSGELSAERGHYRRMAEGEADTAAGNFSVPIAVFFLDSGARLTMRT